MSSEDISLIKTILEIAIIIVGIGMLVQKVLNGLQELREDLTEMKSAFEKENSEGRAESAKQHQQTMSHLQVLEKRQTKTEIEVGKILARWEEIENGRAQGRRHRGGEA